MAGEEERAERGFTVVDKRASAEPETGGEAAMRAEAPPSPSPSPGVDFSSLCLSLAISAQYHMGIAGHPESQQPIPKVELPMARQTIDTLEMLERKTRGNLDAEEAKLLETLLYELRMHYVEATKATPDAAGD